MASAIPCYAHNGSYIWRLIAVIGLGFVHIGDVAAVRMLLGDAMLLSGSVASWSSFLSRHPLVALVKNMSK